MNCTEFEAWLADREMTAGLPARFEGHLADCEACRTAWRGERLLDRALSQWPPVDAVPDFRDRVVAELSRSTHTVQPFVSPQRRIRSTRWLAVSGSLVSLVLVAVIGGRLSFDSYMSRQALDSNGAVANEMNWDTAVGELLATVQGDYQQLTTVASTGLRPSEIVALPRLVDSAVGRELDSGLAITGPTLETTPEATVPASRPSLRSAFGFLGEVVMVSGGGAS
ncbi:MAG: hypothetical protein KF777_22640 [Planctomycetaceae bacterium]|nr:hypothetical protein [Planctomycetaceae bacterium]